MKHMKAKKTDIAETPTTILTVRELSDYLRVHPITIYRLLSTKQIPAFRIGSDWRFDINSIERWCSQEAPTAVRARHNKRSA